MVLNLNEINPAKSVQEHNAATTKHDDHDNKTHMLQLYHIDSDPNISSSKHPAYQTPSFKDATMIDMTEYPLDKNEDRNEDKEGDVMEFNNIRAAGRFELFTRTGNGSRREGLGIIA
ncbi:hypothetical protein BGZ67_008605 [Mortierella alpina]|nr:hypothetical protein BGZ67_008605 [Mortierella alpina]